MRLADIASSYVSKKEGNAPKEPGEIKRYTARCPLPLLPPQTIRRTFCFSKISQNFLRGVGFFFSF